MHLGCVQTVRHSGPECQRACTASPIVCLIALNKFRRTDSGFCVTWCNLLIAATAGARPWPPQHPRISYNSYHLCTLAQGLPVCNVAVLCRIVLHLRSDTQFYLQSNMPRGRTSVTQRVRQPQILHYMVTTSALLAPMQHGPRNKQRIYISSDSYDFALSLGILSGRIYF